MATATSLPLSTHISAHMSAPPDKPTEGSSSAVHTASTSVPAGQRTYTHEDFVRFAELALASAYSEQLPRGHGQTRPSRSNARNQSHPYLHTSPSTNGLQRTSTMKPRVHMYEFIQQSEGSQRPQRLMVATLELPGLVRSDVNITVRPSGELVVSGERHEHRLSSLMLGNNANLNHGERRGRTVYNEFKFGRFQRTFRLPVDIDCQKIVASMNDGMLTIKWPLPDVRSQSPKPQPTQTSRSSSPVSQSGSDTVKEASRTDDSQFGQHTGNDSSGEEEKIDELTGESDTQSLEKTDEKMNMDNCAK